MLERACNNKISNIFQRANIQTGVERMNSVFKKTLVAAGVAVGLAAAPIANAADKVNVAFFLEWATPNLA
jgi:hypothetical protein